MEWPFFHVCPLDAREENIDLSTLVSAAKITKVTGCDQRNVH